MQKWLRHIQKYRLPLFNQVTALVQLHGEGVEIGSGSSWFSILASGLPSVQKIDCVEISRPAIDAAKTYFLPKLGGNAKKLIFHQTDFHQLPFADKSKNFILCDAALHHTTTLPLLLKELNRVLKPHGVLIALREPILPRLVLLKTLKKYSFGWRQRLRGDIEKTYTMPEWQSAFQKGKFKLSIHEAFLHSTLKERLLYYLKKYNNLFFNRYLFVAYKY